MLKKKKINLTNIKNTLSLFFTKQLIGYSKYRTNINKKNKIYGISPTFILFSKGKITHLKTKEIISLKKEHKNVFNFNNTLHFTLQINKTNIHITSLKFNPNLPIKLQTLQLNNNKLNQTK